MPKSTGPSLGPCLTPLHKEYFTWVFMQPIEKSETCIKQFYMFQKSSIMHSLEKIVEVSSESNLCLKSKKIRTVP